MKLLMETWREYSSGQLLLEGDAAAAFEAEMENFMKTTVKKLATIEIDKPQEKEELEEVAVMTAVGIAMALPKIIQMIGDMVKWIEPKLKTFIGAGEKRRSATTGEVYHTGEAKVGNAILAWGTKGYKIYLGFIARAIKKIGKGVGADWDDAEVKRAAEITYHILLALLFVQSGYAFTKAAAGGLQAGTLNFTLIKDAISTATRGDSLIDFVAKLMK
jgi:hypothetical protein